MAGTPPSSEHEVRLEPQPGVSREMVYRVIGWVLNFGAVVALAIGASFFSDLKDQLKDLNENMGSLKTMISVSREREGVLAKELTEIKAEISAIKEDVTSLKIEAAKRK